MDITYNYSSQDPEAISTLQLTSENQAEYFQLKNLEEVFKKSYPLYEYKKWKNKITIGVRIKID